MANPKSVDASLWWDSFSHLLTELDDASISSDPPPPHLAKKLKDNCEWFVDTVSMFKQPNEKSRDALNSQQVKIGSRLLSIKPQLKDKALQVSACLCLDEVQSYILVERSLEDNNAAVDFPDQEFLHTILLQYYIERQCLLKCTRQVLMHALYTGNGTKEGDIIREVALELVSNGLESKIISVLQDLLSSSYPEQMDVDLYTLWAEETLIEDSLVLDILFLVYYESFSTCNGNQWKRLCALYKEILYGSYNFGKLAISTEAIHSSNHIKVQLLLILMETLDLEHLLQMVHDETPFRQDAAVFSLTDVQEIDAIVASFDAKMNEAGPLVLTWAVFLCLISSLPGKEENNVLVEIDHVGYVRQAFEAASLSYFLEILQNDILMESDGPIGGYRSVLRTFISAFIASYEISIQFEDSTFNLILDILCKIYRGEESLCIQFWDRGSFIDGPIRCLLCNLEGEFPFRTVELVRLLSSLCEGTWPAECVYNFLDKSVGISSLFEISNGSLVDNVSQIVETHLPLHVPGLDTMLIPSKTRGQILKVINGDTALVRWEFTQSGVLILLLRLAQAQHIDDKEEVLCILDLLGRMVSSNMAICVALMDIGNSLHVQPTDMNVHMEKNFWVVEMICNLIRNLCPSPVNAAVMSMGVNILTKMLKCAPSDVSAVALRANILDLALETNIFDVGCYGSSRLIKMLLIDCEQNDNDCLLTISVLDFTMQLLETGLENNVTLALVVLSLQYVLVNHGYWKFRAKHFRWKVTLKVLEVMKKCIVCTSYSEKLGEVIRTILLSDSSIHNTLFRVICTTKQSLEKLHTSRLFELTEIEGLQLAIYSVLDILFIMLSKFSKDISSSLSVFHQAVLSSTTKPIPVVAAVISLISYFQNPAIQVGAAKVLSMILIVADYLQPFAFGIGCFSLDDKQIAELRHSVKNILLEQMVRNEDLFVAILNLLTSAARYQPAFLVSIFASEESMDAQPGNATGVKQSTSEASFGPPDDKKSGLVDALLRYVERAGHLINSNPSILLNVLNFLKALWQGAGHYTSILEMLNSSEKFWKQLQGSISPIARAEVPPLENMPEVKALSLGYKYQCQSIILEIMAYEIFQQKKFLRDDMLLRQSNESKERIENAVSTEKSKATTLNYLKDVLSTWCEKSVLGSLIKSYTSCEYENETYYRAKVATSLLIMLVMGKVAARDAGSISISLLEKIHVISQKLSSQPSFSELLSQYSRHGYSEGKEIKSLIFSDLYYHLQGELEGRKIGPGPFKELSQYMLESELLQRYQHKFEDDLFTNAKDVYLFDPVRLRSELGLDMWDYLEWKASKPIAETMLHCMQDANSMVLHVNAKLSALKALITILTVYKDNSQEKNTTEGGKIPDQLILSSIDRICQCYHATVESLAPVLDASEDIINYLAAQAELLFHLIQISQNCLSLPVCIRIFESSGSGLKVMNDFRSSITGVKITMKLLLMSILLAVEFSLFNLHLGGATSIKSTEDFTEVCSASLGILPILCNCITAADNWTISLTAIDLILRSLLTPTTWFPIIQKHLQLQHIIMKLQDKNSLEYVPVILKFFLTLASVRGGALMLLNCGFCSSLKVLFADLSDGRAFLDGEVHLSNTSDKSERPQDIWGLGLAVITAMVHSLGDSSSCKDIVDIMIPYFFSEKAHLISYYLNAPDFPSNDQDKKRPRAQRTQTSLTALKQTENTLLLMCVLAKHWNSWVRGVKEIHSQLREKSIHLLAFISRGSQYLGDSSRKIAPLLCPPVLKEEVDSCQRTSFINVKHGWFALTPLGCVTNPRFAPVSSTKSTLSIKDQASGSTEGVSQSCFSDSIAIEIYRISFLLLKFLCLQAEGAAKRAEEVGFIDLAHFPELPMPEILHGLQDQAVAIVSELCEASKSKHIRPDIQSVCLLLLHTVEMALYLELCVVQICGIRPVLGRVDDFSKEVKSLVKATEGHVFLKASLKSLKQIISIVYPDLLQTEGLL